MALQKFVTLVGGNLTVASPVQSSAGTGSNGAIVALNSSGTIDTTMLPAGVAADTATAVATAAISAGMLVNIYSNAGVLSVRPADASTPAAALGFATAAIANGATGTVQMGPGIVAGLTGLTLGSSYFLGTAGTVTTTAPTTAGQIVQAVGIAVSATSLNFQPAPMPITLA